MAWLFVAFCVGFVAGDVVVVLMVYKHVQRKPWATVRDMLEEWGL